jgi:hypothetical protein
MTASQPHPHPCHFFIAQGFTPKPSANPTFAVGDYAGYQLTNLLWNQANLISPGIVRHPAWCLAVYPQWFGQRA